MPATQKILDELSAGLTIEGILSLLNASNLNLTKDEQSVFLNTTQMRTFFVDRKIHPTELIASHIAKYAPPFILLLGIMGNITSLHILLRRAMIRQTTNLFLAVLALSDCIVLVIGLLRGWIGHISGTDILTETDWLCKFVSFLTYGSSHFSVWLIVAVTAMRYIAVSKPHQASRFCHQRTAKRVITLLVVFACVLNLHFVWSVQLRKHVLILDVNTRLHCGPKNGFEQFIYHVWPWVDASVFALAPFVLLVVLNTLIIVHTRRATLWRRLNQPENMNMNGKQSEPNRKVTLTLLAVSFSFVVTTLPMAIVMVLQNYWKNDSSATTALLAQRKLIRTVAEMLMYVNHSMNFFLYCLVGKKFRDQLVKTFSGKTSAATSTTTDHSGHKLCMRERRATVRKETSSLAWV